MIIKQYRTLLHHLFRADFPVPRLHAVFRPAPKLAPSRDATVTHGHCSQNKRRNSAYSSDGGQRRTQRPPSAWPRQIACGRTENHPSILKCRAAQETETAARSTQQTQIHHIPPQAPHEHVLTHMVGFCGPRHDKKHETCLFEVFV